MTEFVNHHSLEYICLVIDIVGPVSPKDVQDFRRDEEAADAHPETVGEGGEGEGDNEIGKERGYEDDERFGGYEVEE